MVSPITLRLQTDLIKKTEFTGIYRTLIKLPYFIFYLVY